MPPGNGVIFGGESTLAERQTDPLHQNATSVVRPGTGLAHVPPTAELASLLRAVVAVL